MNFFFSFHLFFQLIGLNIKEQFSFSELYDCTHSEYLYHLAFFPHWVSCSKSFITLQRLLWITSRPLSMDVHLPQKPVYSVGEKYSKATKHCLLLFFFGWRLFQVLCGDNASHPCLWNHLGTSRLFIHFKTGYSCCPWIFWWGYGELWFDKSWQYTSLAAPDNQKM